MLDLCSTDMQTTLIRSANRSVRTEEKSEVYILLNEHVRNI